MSNEKNAAMATDANDLERRILDPNIAKTEAEWWAKRRIEQLEAEHDALRTCIEQLEAEIERLRDAYCRACELIAKMHAAAVGEVTGPKRGVIEGVVDRTEQPEADVIGWRSQAHQNQSYAEQVEAKIAELRAHVARLREALDYLKTEKVDYMIRNKLGDPYAEHGTMLAVKAIEATPAQSLARIKNQVREECAKTAIAHMEGYPADAIRATKEPE